VIKVHKDEIQKIRDDLITKKNALKDAEDKSESTETTDDEE
jgi:hypothetical protein